MTSGITQKGSWFHVCRGGVWKLYDKNKAFCEVCGLKYSKVLEAHLKRAERRKTTEKKELDSLLENARNMLRNTKETEDL